MHNFKAGGPTKVQYLCLGIHGWMNHTLRRQLKILSAVKIKAYFTKDNLDLVNNLRVAYHKPLPLYLQTGYIVSRRRQILLASLAAYSVKK